MRSILIENQQIPLIGQGVGVVDGTIKDRISCLREGSLLGMNFIDTAESYSDGISEDLVGQAFNGRDSEFICTKVSPENLKYSDLMNSCNRSLAHLRRDEIDLYYLHWPHPSIPIDETLEAIQSLMERGKIRHFGLSNFSTNQLKYINNIVRVFAIQVEYNLLDRTMEEEFLDYCRANNILIVAYSPLYGINSIEDHRIDVLRALSTKYDRTIHQVTLNWIASRNVVSIPKTKNIEHLRQNSCALDFDIDSSDLEMIDWTFKLDIRKVRADSIDFMQIDKAYKTKDEAIKNPFGFSPSPLELSKQLDTDPGIKPVRVKQENGKYILTGGLVRYWAWRIAFGDEAQIKASVR